MSDDPLLAPLAEAVADLVAYIDSRPETATADDDVRALEGVAHRFHATSAADRIRLRQLLGADLSDALGVEG